MKIALFISIFLTVLFVFANDDLSYADKKNGNKKSTTLKDLAPRRGEYHVTKIRRKPSSSKKIIRKNTKAYFFGGCRDSFGRNYGPGDPGYNSCINDEVPSNDLGPFRKRKVLGLGILLN